MAVFCYFKTQRPVLTTENPHQTFIPPSPKQNRTCQRGGSINANTTKIPVLELLNLPIEREGGCWLSAQEYIKGKDPILEIDSPSGITPISKDQGRFQ